MPTHGILPSFHLDQAPASDAMLELGLLQYPLQLPFRRQVKLASHLILSRLQPSHPTPALPRFVGCSPMRRCRSLSLQQRGRSHLRFLLCNPYGLQFVGLMLRGSKLRHPLRHLNSQPWERSPSESKAESACGFFEAKSRD